VREQGYIVKPRKIQMQALERARMDARAETDRLERLMRAAQDGDGAAYLRLLTEITPILRRAVQGRRRFLQPSDVEDLVQDILVSLHSVRATYDPARPFLPWLMAIAHNRLADAARRYGRGAANEVLVAEIPETFSEQPANNADGTYGDPEALRQAIGRLPPGQRRAIELLKLREMSLKEAAVASGMSVAALKVAVHRGMIALRKALGSEG
jgi:RNA polymerase sigma-70 factor (ECF subfamily)